MALCRGFLVSEAHVSMLRSLRPDVRAAVLGAAFSQAFDLDGGEAPADEFGVLAALAAAVASDALDFDERGEELRRKDAARKRGRRGCGGAETGGSENVRWTKTASDGRENRPADAENVLRTDENEGVQRTLFASVGQKPRPSDAENVRSRIEENRKEEKGSVCNAHTRKDPPTADRIASWAEVHFSPPPPREFVDDFHARMTEGDWRDARGRDLLSAGCWQRELSAWWAQEKKHSAPRGRDDVPASTGAGRVAVPLFDGGEAE